MLTWADQPEFLFILLFFTFSFCFELYCGVLILHFVLQVSLKINLLENMPATDRTQLVTLKGGVLLSGKCDLSYSNVVLK